MGKIIEASELPSDTKVYLKKDSAGWRVVEPVTYDARPIKVNNKIDWSAFNWKRIILGTKRERRFMYLIIFLALISYLAFDEQLANYNAVVNNPCAYCNSCQEQTRQVIDNMKIGEGRRFPSELNISIID